MSGVRSLIFEDEFFEGNFSSAGNGTQSFIRSLPKAMQVPNMKSGKKVKNWLNCKAQQKHRRTK